MGVCLTAVSVNKSGSSPECKVDDCRSLLQGFLYDESVVRSG